MTADITRRRLLGGTAAAGLLALSGCTGSTPFVGRRIEETETIAPDGADRLSIRGDTGEVRVTGADRNDVHLDVVKQSSSIRTDLDDLVLETERTDDRLELRSVWEGSDGWFTSRPAMNLDAKIPRGLAIERVETETGEVTLRDVEGDTTARTSTGRVDVRSVSGSVTARTSTGRIEIADVSDAVTASASTGRIDVRNVGRLGDVSTSTGRISAEVPAIDGDTTISASTGRITAAVSPDLDADLVATTNTGRIDVDDLALDDAADGGDRVTGTLGDGGPTLRVETNTGRITIRSLE